MTSYPPVPPPPRASADSGTTSFDFARAFTFPFQDPDWLSKTLIGGLFTMLGLLLVGHFFVLGYLAQLVRNVIAGHERPLPGWDELGTYFVEGFKLALVGIVLSLPILIPILIFVIPAAILEGQGAESASGVLGIIMMCLVVPLMLIVMVIMPAALTRAAAHGRAGAAFEFGAIITFLKTNAVNYLLAILVYLVANFASQFGLILFCIGIFFTSFLSLVMTAYAFAETYRLSPVK